MKFWTRFPSRLKALLSPKRPFKLTGGGWVFILYTIGVGAGAINTGNNLLYLIFGLFLGFIMASGVLSDMNLWRVNVAWYFPQAAEARKPCSIPLSVTNRKAWFPSLSITVVLEGTLNGQPSLPTVFVPSLLSGETLPREALFTPERRGYYQLERVRLYTKFPFGLLRKQWTVKGVITSAAKQSQDGREREIASSPSAPRNDGFGFYVYPALIALTEMDYAGFLAGQEEHASSDRRGEGSNISGLRDFAPDDSAKRIHWKASAKHVSLLVRETDLDKKRDVELYWPGDANVTEEFIEFTASLIWGFSERGHGVRFFVGGTHVEEPMPYLSVVDLKNPLIQEVAANLSDRLNVLEAYGQWKKRK